ncbi:hypothetical protein ANN_07369 [Periplaneta americana]|uniref:DUF4817 domain-containing protein n=1 Tax=Periplaneta americana TaxID=6978 RepID=A0ABQ8SZL4_PERAM|nr:hypothetical protein ANN_07369 [Periplaneta americana]
MNMLGEHPQTIRENTEILLEASKSRKDKVYDYVSSLPSKETLRGHSDSSFRGEGYIQVCVGVRLCDMYSNQELAEIHFMYGMADGNAALARRLYQERYPQRQCPDRKTFGMTKIYNSRSTGGDSGGCEHDSFYQHTKGSVASQCSSYDCLETVERVSIVSLSYLRAYAILLEFGIVFAGQWDIDVRSVFKQEVDILNIFCNDNDLRKEKRSGEFQSCEGHNSEMKHFRTHVSLMLAGSEFQSLGRAIVKEDEYEEVRWDGIVSIVSWRERVFRLWWEERYSASSYDERVVA